MTEYRCNKFVYYTGSAQYRTAAARSRAQRNGMRAMNYTKETHEPASVRVPTIQTVLQIQYKHMYRSAQVLVLHALRL